MSYYDGPADEPACVRCEDGTCDECQSIHEEWFDVCELPVWDDTWSLDHWYMDGQRYYVSSYGDEAELVDGEPPSAAEVYEAWATYYQYVLDSEQDPLEQCVAPPYKVRERWQFRFGRSIAGLVLRDARRAGKQYQAQLLPEHVREYLELDGRKLMGFAKAEQYQFEKLTGLKVGPWQTVRLERWVPRSSGVQRLWRRRTARHCRDSALKLKALAEEQREVF